MHERGFFVMAVKKSAKNAKRYTITLAQNIQNLLEKHSKKNGISKSALISIALIEKFEKLEKGESLEK